MTSIVDILRELVELPESALTEAEARAARIGGRIDTSLLEAGYLTEPQLEDALSRHHGLPPARRADLAGIPEAVIGLFSPQLAQRYSAVPFAAGPSRIDLAVASALDPGQLDELAFVLSQRVRLHVASEPRLAEALETHYSVPMTGHLRHLLDRLERGLVQPPQETGPTEPLVERRVTRFDLASPPLGVPERRSVRHRLRPPTEPDPHRKIELTPAERAAIFGSSETDSSEGSEVPEVFDERQAASDGGLPPSAEGRDLAELDRELRRADSPTGVCRAFLDLLTGFGDSTLLFRPEGALLRGWLAGEVESDSSSTRELLLGPGLSKHWRELVGTQPVATVELDPSAEAAGLPDRLGTEAGAEAVLTRIDVGGRLAGLAVTVGLDASPGLSATLRQGSILTGMALERWILAHRTGGEVTAGSAPDPA